MQAQILVAEEMEDLAVRVTDAVLAVVVDRAAQLTDPGLRSAAGALVVAAREQLAQAPVDPEPLVRAILRGDPFTPRSVDAEKVLAVATAAGAGAAPSYWPAVPAISDELFAEYAANSPKEPDGNPSGSSVTPQRAEETPDSPAVVPEPATDPGPELKPAHGGRFHTGPLRRKKSRQ